MAEGPLRTGPNTVSSSCSQDGKTDHRFSELCTAVLEVSPDVSAIQGHLSVSLTLSPTTPCTQQRLNEGGRTQCASPAPWPPASLVPTCTLDVGWLGICSALRMLSLASVSPLEESCLYPSPPLCHSSAAVKKKNTGVPDQCLLNE